ncbi:MAG: hypothetical protein HYZ13_16905, partial [Acidobacteria bacterium]|nr:hypothetical protein [Acidobacteriota bacterium]
MFMFDPLSLLKSLPTRPQRIPGGLLWASRAWRGVWATLLVFLMSFQTAQMAYAGNASNRVPLMAGVIPMVEPQLGAEQMDPASYIPTTATSSMPVMAGEPDISGPWKDAYGYPMNFYQDGTTLSGDWNYGGTKHLVTGTMNGYSLTGAMKNP